MSSGGAGCSLEWLSVAMGVEQWEPRDVPRQVQSKGGGAGLDVMLGLAVS